MMYFLEKYKFQDQPKFMQKSQLEKKENAWGTFDFSSGFCFFFFFLIKSYHHVCKLFQIIEKSGLFSSYDTIIIFIVELSICEQLLWVINKHMCPHSYSCIILWSHMTQNLYSLITVSNPRSSLIFPIILF